MTTPLLELKDVAVRFGPQEVLRGVSLAIEPGQTVAFIGESGCGKTCLLKLIVGLLKPTEGDV
ncbi:MAG: ATP-binding cassette domain-containing protein, partial [Planctomycetia bacterium]|nr:ATP-binding cassette domain-containing protein [Planctomycetia bacterium]